jgi:hypothetical protein
VAVVRKALARERLDIAPSVQLHISADLAAARDLMRPGLALYIGGMGSRKQNFYNALVQRYGFEDAAREVQDLYFDARRPTPDGRRAAAAAALPDALIDLVSLCGPPMSSATGSPPSATPASAP